MPRGIFHRREGRMLHRKVDRWERSFRTAAKRDTHAILRAHLQRLDLSESAELLLEGTVQAVRACSHYYALDHHDAEQFEQFLKMQQYQPGDVGDACYAFTF